MMVNFGFRYSLMVNVQYAYRKKGKLCGFFWLVRLGCLGLNHFCDPRDTQEGQDHVEQLFQVFS